MKPAANSQSPPYSQPFNNSQTFTYDLPNNEPDLNAHPWDPNYSYSTPEGSGGEVKLLADTRNVPGQTPGERISLFFLTVLSFNLPVLQKRQETFKYPLPSNPLQPQPSHRDLHSWSQCQITWCWYPHAAQLLHPLRNHPQPYHPPKRQLLKVNTAAPCEAVKRPVQWNTKCSFLMLTPADKEPLPGNPNVVLVSLGKLLSEERGQ